MKSRNTIDLWLKYLTNYIVFIPTLGLVRTKDNDLSLLLEKTLNYKPGSCLNSYEPDFRWNKNRSSYIDENQIMEFTNGIGIPVISLSSVIIYIYSSQTNLCNKLLDELKMKYKKYKPIKVVCVNSSFNNLDSLYHTLFFYKDFQCIELSKQNKDIKNYNDLTDEEQSSIDLIADNDLAGIIGFWKHILSNHKKFNSSIYCYTDNGKVVGFLGPVDSITNFYGEEVLLPGYFGVISEYRQSYIGNALWKFFMEHGVKNQCKYIVFNARAKTPAEYFYRRNGFKEVGYSFTYSIL